MKYLIQINGENPALTGETEKMFDCEYEFVVEVTNKNLNTLQDVLDRAIDSPDCDLFNYQFMKL